jgi:hypothetical protein
MRATGLGLLLAAAALGCASHPASDATDGSAEAQALAFCARLASAVEARALACVPRASSGRVGQDGADLASRCGRAAAAVGEGRATFEPAATDGCVAAVAAIPCDAEPWTSLDPLRFCRAAFRGTIAATAVGAAGCVDEADCDGGSCSATTLRCPGSCLAWLSAGDPCPASGTRSCAPGLVCDPALGTCRVPSSAGSPCPCAPGLRCDASGICQPRIVVGACTATADCAVGRGCVGGRCVAQKAAGVGCSNAGECALGLACPQPILIFNNVCAPEPGIGASCCWSDMSEQCPYATVQCVGGWCDRTDYKCKAFQPPFGPCGYAQGGLECGPDAACSNGRCFPVNACGE